MSQLVISAENVSKRYRLGTVGYGSMKDDLKAWWNLRLGKEDPFTKVGEKSRLELSGDFWALKGVDLRVEQGDRLGVIGRNGAGKSTLLKLLSRVTSPTTGSIKIKGRIASLLEVGTGFHGELTGRENIFLNGAIMGMKRREIQANFDRIVAFSEVEQFIDTPVKRYSSGMFVRLAFAVASHLNAEILIIDEVLAVGDASFQEKSISKMEQLTKEEGKTILFVSHQTQFLRRLCSKGLLLEDGRVSYFGTMADTLDLYLPVKNTIERKKWTKGTAKFPFSEFFEPLEFYIADPTGEPTTEVNDKDDYSIVVKVQVNRPDPRIGLAVRFFDEQDRMIFVSDIYDSLPLEQVGGFSGEVTFRVDFMRELYLDKTYSVELIAYMHQLGGVLDPDNETKLSFRFHQQRATQWRRGEHRAGSFVMPGTWSRKA